LLGSLLLAGCSSGTDEFREITSADLTSNTAGPVPESPGTTTDKTNTPVDPPKQDTPQDKTANGLSGTDTPPKALPGEDNQTPPVTKRKIKLLVKEKSFKVEGPQGAWRVSYDDFDLLKVLNMDPVPTDAPAHMPGWLKKLDGQRIRVRGFMYPTFQDPVPAFVLARDNQICCFGRNPKVYDLVRVTMRTGQTSAYIQNRPFDVVGRFHIAEQHEEGKLLYRLDDAIVIDR
jgi:hypothetical protein